MKRKIAPENACSHFRKLLGKNRTRQPWNLTLHHSRHKCIFFIEQSWRTIWSAYRYHLLSLWFTLRTAQSQYPNLYKHYKSHSMECESVLFVMNHLPYLWGLSNSFSKFHWFLQLQSCFVKWYEKERSMKLRPLRIHNGGCFETLNLLYVSSCEMFSFCDVFHKRKQNKKKRKQTLESAQYGLEVIFQVRNIV